MFVVFSFYCCVVCVCVWWIFGRWLWHNANGIYRDPSVLLFVNAMGWKDTLSVKIVLCWFQSLLFFFSIAKSICVYSCSSRTFVSLLSARDKFFSDYYRDFSMPMVYCVRWMIVDLLMSECMLYMRMRE